MGCVRADTECEAQQRTPGLASIPIVGNLFKRKLTTRQNSEILFFITPRIYGPDYNGRRTSGTVSNGQRTVTIPQPVPLGNPPSNTPTPTQLQQQPQSQPSTHPSTQPQLLSAPLPNSPTGTTTARPGTLSGQRP